MNKFGYFDLFRDSGGQPDKSLQLLQKLIVLSSYLPYPHHFIH